MKNVLKNHHSGLQQQLLQQLLFLSGRHLPSQSSQLFQCYSKKFFSSNSHRIKPKEKVALIQGEENYDVDDDDELIQAESDLTTTSRSSVPKESKIVDRLAWYGTMVDVKTSNKKRMEGKVTSPTGTASNIIPVTPSTHASNGSNSTTIPTNATIQQRLNTITNTTRTKNNKNTMTVAKNGDPIVRARVYEDLTATADSIADERTESLNINIKDKVSSSLQFIHHSSKSSKFTAVNTSLDPLQGRKVKGNNSYYNNRNWWPSMACEFGYKPEEWCNAFPIAVNGTRQSPIDISSSTCNCLSTDSQSLDLTYPQAISGLEVKNTGHGWVVNIPEDASRNSCEYKNNEFIFLS